METFGAPNLADFFPVLKGMDPQGIRRRAEFYLGKLLDAFQYIISRRLEERRASTTYSRRNDLLEVLLDLSQQNEADWNHKDIKHLFLVSTDVNCVDKFLCYGIEKCSVNQALIKETFRLHPAGTLLVRQADADKNLFRLPLAHRMVHLMMASLIHKFDWEPEDGIKPENINMSEKIGLTLPLKAIPTRAEMQNLGFS
ncbi:hypothetical protein ACH5RR_023950 [Cinchona calisaya]|uniref:Cytochrome P450 n=1 Tax=Cinchona calisaya TaxID=153742 RepID=A0ABD2ZC75_9GENT